MLPRYRREDYFENREYDPRPFEVCRRLNWGIRSITVTTWQFAHWTPMDRRVRVSYNGKRFLFSGTWR